MTLEETKERIEEQEEEEQEERELPLPCLLTAKDVQDILGIGERATYLLLNQKDFPSFKISGEWRVRPELLVEWCDAQIERGEQ